MTNHKQGLGFLPVLLISSVVTLIVLFGYSLYQKNKIHNVINKRFEKLGLKIQIDFDGNLNIGNKRYEVDELGDIVDGKTNMPISYLDLANEIKNAQLSSKNNEDTGNENNISSGNLGTPVFDYPEHDFKNINSGTQVKHQYKFKNLGKGDLLIRNCTAACGCSSLAWSRNSIKPGEEGYVEVTFNSTGRGSKEGLENIKNISVDFENSTVKQVSLVYKATVFTTSTEE